MIIRRRKVREQNLAEACPDCGKKAGWLVVSRAIPQEFRGYNLNVEAACHECSQCGFRILTDAQLENIRKNTLRAYQLSAGLMTDSEIANARKQMGWSQADLAKRTGLGIASIKRWESGLIVQTEANNTALRKALIPVFADGFHFCLTMDAVETQCFNEVWQNAWDIKQKAVLPRRRNSIPRISNHDSYWNSSLAVA